MLSRRAFISASGAAAVAACPLCRAALAAEEPHWTYEEVDHWGELSPEFRTCSVGTQQSPIDLTRPVPSALGDIAVEWQAKPATIVNNGHSIQINPEPGSVLRIAGQPYAMQQFHFHHPAEHLVDGKRLAMEAHFVHSGEGGAAAVGVFLVEGTANLAVGKIWAKMPTTPGEAPLEPVDLAPFLPVSRAYYRYAGSLTTPPCGETVLWTIFAEPVEVSAEQIRTFAALYPMNARPIQKLNRRFLLGSF